MLDISGQGSKLYTYYKNMDFRLGSVSISAQKISQLAKTHTLKDL